MDENLSDCKMWLSLTAVACQYLLCMCVCVCVLSMYTMTIDTRSEVRICLDTLASGVICVCECVTESKQKPRSRRHMFQHRSQTHKSLLPVLNSPSLSLSLFPSKYTLCSLCQRGDLCSGALVSSVREEKLQRSRGRGSREKEGDKKEVAGGRKICFCVFSLAVCECVLSFGLCLEFNIIYVSVCARVC